MDHIQIDHMPELRNPALISAFTGWNDAAQVATSAVQYLLDQWSATKFAALDSEEYYVFTETRPLVSIVDGTHQRQIEWPSFRFYAHSDPALPRDLVFLTGAEPQLKWRTFAKEIVAFLKQVGVTSAFSLGGMIADVPHTGSVRLTGSATSTDLTARLRDLGIQPSRYEGPTGIVGVLHDVYHEAGIPAASLWGVVPHYISATPNPKVTVALLRQLSRMLKIPIKLTDLDYAAAQFEAEVDDAIARNPEAADYVRQLQEHESDEIEEEPEGAPPPELPSGPALVEELEEFLRRNRGEGESNT